MAVSRKSEKELVDEIKALRSRLEGLERSEAECKKDENELQETTQLFETILDTTHILIAYLDPQFNFIKVNRAYALADEKEPSFFPGKNHFDLYPNEENEATFRRVVETGESYFANAKPFEYAEHPERGISYWDWSLIPIKNQHNSVTGLLLSLANVTERKQAEEALRESEGKLSAMLQSFADHMSMMDKDLNIIWANEKARNIFGEDIVGMKCYKAYHRRDKPCEPYPCLTLKAFQDGKVHEHDTQVLDKDGKSIYFHCTANVALKDANGKPTGVLEISRDITDRKLAEEALRQSGERYRALFEEARDGIMLADAETALIVDCNRAASEMLERDKSELIGQHQRIIHPSSSVKDGFSVSYKKHLEESEGQVLEEQVVTSSGKIKNVAIKANLLYLGEKKLIQGIFRDITERKKAEEALRESENSYRAVVENAVEGIVVVQGQMLQFVNPGLVSMLGYSEKELLTRPFIEFVHPDHREWAMGIHIKRLKGEEVPPVYELKIVDKKGNTKWLENNGILIKWRNRPATLNFLRDITEHKKAEEALRLERDNFTNILDSMEDGVYIVDQNHDIQYVNPALKKEFGQFEGRKCYEYFHDRKEVCPWCKNEEVFAGKTVRWEWYSFKNQRTYDLIDTPLRNPDGSISKLEIFRDITERKKAEQAIWASESEKRSILNAISDIVLFQDTDLTVRWCNEAAARSIGMTQRELVGCYCYELWHGRSEPCEQCPVLRAIETGSHTEGIVTTPDGKSWEIIGEPVCDRDGKIKGAIEIARDITERKRAEEALQQSEERLKILFESAPDAIYLNDLKGNIVDGNKAAEEMTGYKREELIGKNIAESGLLSPEQVPEVIARLEKNAMGKSVGPEEFTLKRKDGSYVTVEVRTFPVKIGNQTLSLGIARDISAHKKAAEALREERDRAQKYLDVAAVIFVVLDANGRVTLINNRGCKILRYKEEDIIGKNWFDNFLPEGVRKDVKAVFKKLMTGNLEPFEYFENPILTKDGDERLIAWNNTLLRTEQGEIIGTLSSGEDVTERKKTEKALRESELKFKTIFENAGGAIFIADNKTGEILECNSQAEQMLGRPRAEIIGMHQSELHPKGEEEKYKQKFAAHVQKGHLIDFEGEVQHRDGRRTPVCIASQCLKVGGKDVIIGLFMDNTERKQAEQKLLDDQEQLKSLASQLTLAEERERRRIASDLHDQISQSLVISKMKLEALCKSGYGEELDKALDEVCNSLGWTIQDTRTLTFDLSSPILYELGFEAAVAEWLDEQIRQKHGIETEFEDDEQPKPLEDDIRVLLFRDVRELLINVVKHANAQNVKVSIYRIGEQVCVIVEDDGVGFDPDKVASMAAKKAEFGLFSIRQRLEQLRGHLEIKSEPGHGSRITMVAPLKSK